MFVPDTVIYMEGPLFLCRQSAVEINLQRKLKVTGKSLQGKSKDRIVYRIYNKTASPEQIVWDH